MERNSNTRIAVRDVRPGGIAVSDAADFEDLGSRSGEERGEVELTIVTMTFDAADDAALLAILSKYVVLTRMQDGCRNVDLCSSVTHPGRHLVVQKWETPQHQRLHFDSEVMVDMASACVGVLSRAPDIDLWDATSAHDLR
jgi:quinol monooxygenase YgiN